MCMVGLVGFCDLPPHGWLIGQSMQCVAGFVGVERFELSTSRTRTVGWKMVTWDSLMLELQELCGVWLGHSCGIGQVVFSFRCWVQVLYERVER